jgi:phosphoglycolate phosphatase
MKKRLVIFDMDGTLADSSRAIANAINFVRGRLGLPPMDPATIVSKINDPRLNAAEYFYETERFEPRHEEWFAEYYSANHHRELLLYDGVVKLLETLKARGCLLAVATNAYRRSTLETLRHLGILDRFDAVASYDDVPRGKPAPDMLLKILEELKCRPEEALFVGDGHRDRLAAEAAGIDFILVAWGFSDHGDAVESVGELARLLEARCSLSPQFRLSRAKT